ncbi:MAG TPA: hypothetical protein PLR44_02955 [Thermomicrobiales bacterium]|nr:hypothetical protein [Thermomicrobiales bacterium]
MTTSWNTTWATAAAGAATNSVVPGVVRHRLKRVDGHSGVPPHLAV